MSKSEATPLTKTARRAANISSLGFEAIERRSILSFTLCCVLILLSASIALIMQKAMTKSVQEVLGIQEVLGRTDNLAREISVVAARLQQTEFVSERSELIKELRALSVKLEAAVIRLRESQITHKELSEFQAKELKTFERLLYEFRLFSEAANELKLNEGDSGTAGDDATKLDFLVVHGHKGLSDTINLVMISITRVVAEIRAKRDFLGNVLFIVSFLVLIGIWFLSFRPILTLIRKQHTDLDTALVEVQSAQRTQSNFLANISHEIRTPMTAILGYSELLVKKASKSDSELSETVGVVHRNAEHLLSLLDDVLALSKIDSGKFQVDKSKIDYQRVLNEVYSLFLAKASEKGVELFVENEGKIPRWIFTDPVRLKQVLLNIIGNAVKFTSSGSIQIRTYLREVDSGKQLLFIDVSDTGIGIRPGDQSKLFAYFSQADSSTQRNHGGTGLGLVLSRNLAKLLGGDLILLSSNFGRGSTFQISIDPGKLEENELIEKLRGSILDDTRSIENVKDSQVKLEGIRILIVDDAKENLRLFKIYLEEYGAEVEACSSGKEALEMVTDKGVNYFHLILLDLQMPELDGFQVLDRVRNELNFTRPVLALTAHGMAHEKAQTRRAGFNDHITKPISAEDLAEAVQSNVSFD